MPHRASTLLLAGLLGALGLSSVPAAAQTKLLRFPDIYDDLVVFCYAGDLWLAPAASGTATRLTAHPGLELFPKFSPDGKWIAFTGQYDGDEQVYVIPVGGGTPRQLTFYPARGPLAPRWGTDNQVYGWTNDGKAVLFRSMRDNWHLSETRLYTVPVEGGAATPLPMPVSGAGAFSPDGLRMAYSPIARDFRTWKRYQGGWAQDLYIFDLQSHEVEQITNDPRTDRDPMWIGDDIYFASDRDGTLNIYEYETDTKKTEQVTHSHTWDVRWPSCDEHGHIVYEMDGELQVLDTNTGASRPINLYVPNDGVAMRPSRLAADKFVEDYALSPKAERALFVARGDIFTVPIEKGPTRNLTNSSSAHDKWARWSPDGKSIAFVSDRSGEDEIWLVNQDGSGEPVQLTKGGTAMRYAPEWSPDGKRLAFSDKDGKVYVLSLDGRKLQQIADDPHDQVNDYAWSPGGGYLAFSMTNDNWFRSVWIWSAGDGTLHRVTDELFDEFDPAWDPDGNYLYFVANHEFGPQIAQVEWNYAIDRQAGVFALALRRDVKHPFPPESDEVSAGDAGDDKSAAAKNGKAAKKGEKAAPSKKEPLRIDFDGLAARVAPVPIPADDYTGLIATSGYLLYVRGAAPFFGRDGVVKPELHIFSMKDRKETTLAEKVTSYTVSGDGSKVLVRHDNEYKLYDATPKGKDSAKVVATKNMMVDCVPAQEWSQIFDEVWRRYRDFFYVPNMHGYDWVALREQYRPLLQYVGHRADLNYVIGEMIAELNVSHTYVAGGDYQLPPRAPVALPGARFELDPKSGRYRIAHIFHGMNEEEKYRSPLTEIGVDARVGDYVLAVDGQDLPGNVDPYQLLRNKADRPVTLALNDKPTLAGARQVTYKPITSETDLEYLEWVNDCREKVATLTGGRVGYIHIPDMGANGIREFIKWYYGQIRKEGLVVDVRSNGGGNVSQMIIERLRRELLGTRFDRLDSAAFTYPDRVFYGHMVCLIDENSQSDGDIFAYMFKQAKLGPLIGKRTWGGVVGINGRGPLLDGGSISVPEDGTSAVDGSWVVEGHGVDPDIVVENDPKDVIAGHDPQLERAVAEALKAMRESPRKLPARPADPVRTQQAGH